MFIFPQMICMHYKDIIHELISNLLLLMRHLFKISQK